MFRIEVEYKRNHKESLPNDWSIQIEKFQNQSGSKRLKFERPVPERCLVTPWIETTIDRKQENPQQQVQQQQQIEQQVQQQQQIEHQVHQQLQELQELQVRQLLSRPGDFPFNFRPKSNIVDMLYFLFNKCASLGYFCSLNEYFHTKMFLLYEFLQIQILTNIFRQKCVHIQILLILLL
jgi:hypothetical protein